MARLRVVHPAFEVEAARPLLMPMIEGSRPSPKRLFPLRELSGFSVHIASMPPRFMPPKNDCYRRRLPSSRKC